MSEDFASARLSTSAPVRGAVAPFSVFLYGGIIQEDEHVTVWDPKSGKTVAGNAAPYRKNLKGWLDQHPGWEEKADELKSSKRRSASRKQKSVSAAFAALCVHAGDLPRMIMNDASFWLRAGGAPEVVDHEGEWTADEDTRLKESIVRLAEELYFTGPDRYFNSEYRWKRICSGFVPRWSEADVLRRSRDLLLAGLQSFGTDVKVFPGTPTGFGSPMESLPQPSPSPNSASLSYLERHLVPPREPRITVWEPSTGRTVSGNAAPCRRNLEAWIKAHPGWEPKSEEQLSSSRRIKGRRTLSESQPISASTPQFALDALILLSQSPGMQSAPLSSGEVKMETASASSDMDVDEGDSDDDEEEEEEEQSTSHRPMMSTSTPMTIPD